MKVTILDTQTGQKVFDENYDSWFWSEGNGACDCNRQLMVLGSEGFGSFGTCRGYKRFLIIASEPPYPLEELNMDYPLELRQKHGLP